MHNSISGRTAARGLRFFLRSASCLAALAALSPTQAAPTQAAPPEPNQAITTQPPTAGSLAELATQLEKSPNTVVAEVDGTPITMGMIADRLHDFPSSLSVLPSTVLYDSARDDLIQQRALAIKARTLGLDKIPVTQRRIQEATDRQLGEALVRRVAPEMVTPKTIQDRYNNTIAKQPGPEEVRFQVIATASESDAMLVLRVLAQGKDFGAVAEKVSKDPSAFNGGEIGFTTRDRLYPEIAAVAFSLLPGQTTALPVQSKNLWFIIHVQERRQRAAPTLAESTPRITNDLLHEAAAEILRKARAAVVVKDYGPTGMKPSDEKPSEKSH